MHWIGRWPSANVSRHAALSCASCLPSLPFYQLYVAQWHSGLEVCHNEFSIRLADTQTDSDIAGASFLCLRLQSALVKCLLFCLCYDVDQTQTEIHAQEQAKAAAAEAEARVLLRSSWELN